MSMGVGGGNTNGNRKGRGRGGGVSGKEDKRILQTGKNNGGSETKVESNRSMDK